MAEANEVADFLLSTERYIVFALGRLNFSVEGFRISNQSMIVHEATHALVDFHRFSCTGAILTVRNPDVAALLTAITAHTSAYPDARVRRTGDGIRGGLLNPWYMPRN